MQGLLARVSPEDALAAGKAIANQLSECPSWSVSNVVALFSSLPGEIDTQPLFARSRRAGKRLLFPRMLAGNTLEFAVVEKVESLRSGRYGVLEPDETCRVHPLDGDAIVFVPGLAFDRRGGRLGRGAGYYDRALAACENRNGRPRFVGVAFESQLIESVPMETRDIRMDCVVTERSFIRCV